MTPSPARALVFMNARNCAPYVGAALESLVWQTHPALHVLFVDDASDDGTDELARALLTQYFAGRHTLVRNPQRLGKAHNAHVHLRAALPHGDFVAVLDADDQLISTTIVADMAARYEAGFDVVWSNYETDQGRPGENGPLDPFLSPRQQGWRTSHFFSFRAELLHGVGEDRFQDEYGEWLSAACDLALAYPVLDQTRRYCFLPVRAYRYTASNPQSHHNQDPQAVDRVSRQQRRCATAVMGKPPLPCRRWLFAGHAAADTVVGQMQQQLLATGAAVAALQAAAPTVRSETPVHYAARPAVPAAAFAAPPSEAFSAVPAAGGPAGAAGDPWTWVAAQELHRRCPGLLALALDGHAQPAPPALLWAWWQWLQRGPARPRVLELGAGPLAAPLHALVQGLGGAITSVGDDRDRAMALYARLDAAGITPDVIHAPSTEAEFDGVAARHPDLTRLSDGAADYDLVIVSAEAGGLAAADALLALPMVAPRLRSEAFRLCLWAPDDAQVLQVAAALWRRAAPDLVYAEGAFAGRALVVHSA